MMAWLSSTPGSITDWLTLLTTSLAGGLAVVRYWVNSRQTKAVRAADEMELFRTDELVQAAHQLLDWKKSRLSLKAETDKVFLFVVDEDTFVRALRYHETAHGVSEDAHDIESYVETVLPGSPVKPPRFSRPEYHIRRVFDAYLDRLERVNTLIERGVIDEADFQSFYSYWIKLIGGKKSMTQLSIAKRDALVRYVNEYEFDGVIKLFKRFRVDLRK